MYANAMARPSTPPALPSVGPLSPNDFHLLLVLADGESYGYALLKAMERESRGAVKPDIGSLYRALARMMVSGLVEAAAERPDEAATPGRQRRYYRLTEAGRRALRADALRLHGALELAEARLAVDRSRS
jgi:DNA-binding PadR family transcriptional regulator